MSQLDILFITVVDTVTTFCGFKIDIGHLAVVAYSLPEDASLIVTQIDTMNMRAGILTLNVACLCKQA
jgi:hypothetical protein